MSETGANMKVTLIHNPDAGDDEQPSGEEILRLIQSTGHAAEYQSSKEENWHSALKEPAEIIAVAGGDGIVGKVAKRLVGRQIPMAILPIGTANNIATSLGLTNRKLTELISGWGTARRVNFDVGIASGPWGLTYFIEGIGVGLFTDTMCQIDARDNMNVAYADDSAKEITSAMKVLRERLKSYRAKTLKLTLDQRDLSGEYILVEAMNTRYLGPNLCLAPEANFCDGLLDVVSVSTAEHGQLRKYLSDYTKTKVSSGPFMVHNGRHLQIELGDFLIHFDDDLWPENDSTYPSTVMDVKVDPHALVFLVSQ
jgi:diacylglycerol kinase (ATP)